ncbi:hypothetical protein IJ103_02855 [Candidatus Saccharibacteria bacterium]|nr:hypothetical protein [Candidatus Saccharibacteria bacterium]MBQ9017156.1 hypothetical protein [Candidatus Saccharibacteria bacterium]
MGIMVQKEDDNTELTKQINADLRERAERTSKEMDPDYVEDSDYAKDLKKTGRFAWVWAVLIILAIISLIIIFI